jgi:type II secretory pathway pseudopilin PulG
LVARRRRRSRGGFTLVELLISMGLSTVGLLGLISLQMVAVRGNMSSRAFTEATGLAQERQEYVQTETYTDLPTYNATESKLNAQGLAQANTTLGPYTRTTAVVADAANNWTTITVTVTWADFENGASNRNHNVVLVTRRSP